MDRDWSGWIGRGETASDMLTPAMVEGLAATLDTPIDLAAGAEAPQGVHWLLAPPRAPMREIGADGHPRRGGFLPPIDLPRRMWAASEVRFAAPLRTGESIERVSRIASVEAKAGSAGPLVFVGVDRSYRVDGETRIEERQTIVYRDVQPYQRPAEADPAAHMPADLERLIRPDPVMLFRYSALTFNGHRIHYDQPYATRVELYPGIVVQAPLTATLCLDLAARTLGPNRLATFSFRGTAPAFANEPLRIAAWHDGDALDFVASAEGRVVAKAMARLA